MRSGNTRERPLAALPRQNTAKRRPAGQPSTARWRLQRRVSGNPLADTVASYGIGSKWQKPAGLALGVLPTARLGQTPSVGANTHWESHQLFSPDSAAQYSLSGKAMCFINCLVACQGQSGSRQAISFFHQPWLVGAIC